MDKREITKFEMILIFACVFFKYLVEYGISKQIMYVYLFILIILVVVDILKKGYTQKEWYKILGLFVISLYFVAMYSNANLLLSFMMTLLIVNKNEKNYIKAFFISSISLFLITIILYGLGLKKSYNLIRLDNGVIKTRYSIGFNHPNQVFMFLLPIVLSGYILFSKKKSYWILTLISSYILYKISDCRTGFFLIILLVIIHFASAKIKDNTIRNIAKISFILLTLISIFIGVKYGKDWENPITVTLNNRPVYWNYYIKNGNAFTPFGKAHNEDIILDNFYLHLMVELGLIGYIIYCYIYSKSISKINDRKYNIAIICFLIYGLFETGVVIGSIQFIFPIQMKSLIESKKEKQIEE